jgi:hypothetical protein
MDRSVHMRKYTHRVIRLEDDEDVGEHTSEALARKRVDRLVSMSRGKRTKADFAIVLIEPTNDEDRFINSPQESPDR